MKERCNEGSSEADGKVSNRVQCCSGFRASSSLLLGNGDDGDAALRIRLSPAFKLISVAPSRTRSLSCRSSDPAFSTRPRADTVRVLAALRQQDSEARLRSGRFNS